MVNYDMGMVTYRGGEYHIFTHELFGRPAYIIAVAEVKKGQWTLEAVVKHFCKVAITRLPYQKPATPEDIKAIIELGLEFAKADPRYPYLTTGAIPYTL